MTASSGKSDSQPTNADASSNVEATLVGDSSLESTPANAQVVISGSTAPSSIQPVVPETLGRYRIERMLGKGAMGCVYLAKDAQLNRAVALKVPNISTNAGLRFFERFQREARAAARLNHANICPVYEISEQNGICFLAMGYIDGRPLSDFIKPGKQQPERQIAAAVRKIALAVQEAHAQGIIHRDLKPGNIMIDARKEPIVMDFGLARFVDDEQQTQLTQEGVRVGTPSYMSPEQIDASRELGPASDVFSLGVILYEMLTMQRPFQGTVVSVIGQILHKEPTPVSQLRPDVSSQMAAICAKAIAKNPDERFASMKEFADALGDFLKGNDLVLGRTARKKTRQDGTSRSMWMYAVGAIVLLLVLAGLVNWLQSGRPVASPPAEVTTTPQTPIQASSAATSVAAANLSPAKEPTSEAAMEEPEVAATDNEPLPEIASTASEPQMSADDQPLDPIWEPDSEAVESMEKPEPKPKPLAVAKNPPPPPPPRSPMPNDPNSRPPGPPDIDEEMRKFDRNEDGVLSKGELPPHVMARADKNKDGKVTRKELEDAHKKYREKLHAPPRGQPPPPPP